MKLATVVLTHANRELTADTTSAIQTWVGDRTLVLVDKIGWPTFQNFRVGDAKVEEGFLHAHPRSPYRNYALGMKKLYEYWSDSDWFLYSEYDTLFTSDAFKEDLEKAAKRNAWIVGVDMRRFDFDIPLLESMLNKGNIKHSYYFLGCCHFLHKKFLEKLHEIHFLETLLEHTKDFKKGQFPGYTRWAFEEELWPTLAAHLGGNLYELVCWKGGNGCEWQSMKTNDPRMIYAGAEHGIWRGKFKLYPVRNAPDICTIDMQPETSITHPSKTLDHIRLFHQNRRKIKRPIF